MVASTFINQATTDAFISSNYGLYFSTVVNNLDPQKRGRIRLNIPGIISNSEWAEPVSLLGGGQNKLGSFIIPAIGSVVLSGFLQGNVDNPIYFGSPYPMNKGPSAIQGLTTEQVVNTRVILETQHYEVVVHDTNEVQKIVFRQKDGNGETIEIDGKDHSILLQSARYIVLNAPLIDITGLQVQIQNRVVKPIGDPI